MAQLGTSFDGGFSHACRQTPRKRHDDARGAENKQILQQVIETAMVADHYTPGLVEDVLIIVLRTSTLVQWDLTYCT